MDKIFVKTSYYEMDNSDASIKVINDFLQEHPTWRIDSLIPISQKVGNGDRGRYGFAVVVTDREK